MNFKVLEFLKSFEKKSFFIFLSAIFLWCLCVFLIFFHVLKWPYIGADFKDDIKGQSIVVIDVTKDTPAARAGIKVGDVFKAIVSVDNSRHDFTGFEATTGRVKINSYENAITTKTSKEKTWEFIKTGKFFLERDDGELIYIETKTTRSFFSLPTRSYVTLFQSLIVICIAAGIFAFASNSIGVNLLTLSGTGLVVNSLTNAILSAKEIVAPPDVLVFVTFTNTLGSMVFIYALLALFWYVPSRINKFPFGLLAVGVGVIIFLLQFFMIYEFPGHPYQVPNLLPLPVALVISAVQWFRTSHNPLERASVMWFMISIYGVTGLVVVLYSVPILLGYAPIISPHVAGFTLSFIYIGIAFGTLKFRLFDVQRIWLKTVVWVIGGLLVVVVDLLLISQFDLSQGQALPLALLLAGWVYFPVRQAIMERFLGSREVNISNHIPDLIQSFAAVDDIELFEGKFIAFVKRTFRAEEIGEIIRTNIAEPKITDNGLSLILPNLRGDSTIQLIGKFGGRQLFSKSDITTVNSYLELVRSLGDIRKQEFNKQKQERERIIRDLHDDVGGRLLSAIYEAPDKKSEDNAKDTLVALKESLIVIEDTQSIDLLAAWEQMKESAQERLKSADLKLSVSEEFDTSRMLSAREYVNLKRIFQEMISNIIKHAEKGKVFISIHLMDDGALCINAKNSISVTLSNGFSSGRGLASIRARLEEINGSITVNSRNDLEDTFEISIMI